MSTAQGHPAAHDAAAEITEAKVTLRPPRAADGAAMWRLARGTGVLDLNSPYAYLMACRWFPSSCVVAELAGEIVGFITGFRPQGRPEVLFIWQVGVDASARGRGIAGRMLDHLARAAAEPPVRHLETTITPSNQASDALFRSFARRHRATVEKSPCFAGSDFPTGDHEPELLYRIGPLATP
jgi:L-2,4-diaminobutyric acid acetyltransferase